VIYTDEYRSYGSSGLVWKSSRVCWGELKIVRVNPDTMEGVGYDPINSITREMRFVIDLKTGRSLLPSPTTIEGKPFWESQVPRSGILEMWP
jgi:hypothetical protein